MANIGGYGPPVASLRITPAQDGYGGTSTPLPASSDSQPGQYGQGGQSATLPTPTENLLQLPPMGLPIPPMPAPLSQNGARFTATNATSNPDPIDVFVIDDFTPETDQVDPNNPNAFFNHGETVLGVVRAGGGNPELASNIQAHSINTDRTDMSRARAIADALDQVTRIALQDPSKVDVVNLSQAAGLSDPETRLVQQKIQTLLDMGIPVVVAAGNNGPNTPNQLAPRGAIVVQSSQGGGVPRSDSGPGFVQAFAPDGSNGQGRQTSFATPEIATLAGHMKSQGLSVPQIRRAFARLQLQNGGLTMGTAPVNNVFTTGTTIPVGQIT